MFKLEINSHSGLTAARAWNRLVIERIYTLLLGFDDENLPVKSSGFLIVDDDDPRQLKIPSG
jgi:hypothetical protein